MAKRPAPRKKSSTAARHGKATRQAAMGVKPTGIKHRARTKVKRSARSGTIGQAAAKVVKSGKRMIAAGAKAAKDKLEGVLHSAADRLQKIAK